MNDTRNDKNMPIMGHLRELRNVLIKCAIALAITTAISFTFTTQILQFLIAPYGGILETIDPTENVTTYFRVALVSGAVLAMPFLVYFIWSFIAPGLEDKEKRYVRFIVPGATILFVVGVAFAWYIMLPAAIGFLSGFEPEIFKTSWRAAAYIPFVTSLMFWIGVAFELPLIVFFLAKLKIVTAKQLLGWWRFAVVGAAIIAALITPTVDPFNMLLVVGPLILLYFLSIVLAKLAR
jgi:sec-independent protein translocase protein TatC